MGSRWVVQSAVGGGRRAAIAIAIAAGLGCSGGDSTPSPTTTLASGERDRPAVVNELVAAVEEIPVDPATTADPGSEPPIAGFDCEALAEAFADTVGDPLNLLVAAENHLDAAEAELVSAAQINVADGLAICDEDPEAAAAHFGAARASVELLGEDP